MLENLMDGTAVDKAGKKIPPTIKDFTSVSTEVSVDFTVVFPKGKLDELQKTKDANGCDGVEKALKLFTTVSTTNMHMFNAECKLHKYSTVEEIIEDFYNLRLGLYGKRKAHLVSDMERKLVRLSNRAKYIQLTLTGAIDLRHKTSPQVQDMLSTNGFDMIDGDYKYLVKMPMDSVTKENVEHIMKEKETTEMELAALMAMSLEKMWLGELEVLDGQYMLYKMKREKIQSGSHKDTAKIAKKVILHR
jgi:DNA topoisomerase-2